MNFLANIAQDGAETTKRARLSPALGAVSHKLTDMWIILAPPPIRYEKTSMPPHTRPRKAAQASRTGMGRGRYERESNTSPPSERMRRR
jgi:hypothetical protein